MSGANAVGSNLDDVDTRCVILTTDGDVNNLSKGHSGKQTESAGSSQFVTPSPWSNSEFARLRDSADRVRASQIAGPLNWRAFAIPPIEFAPRTILGQNRRTIHGKLTYKADNAYGCDSTDSPTKQPLHGIKINKN
jgi:hypothetical protein